MVLSAVAGFCIGAPTLKLSGRYLTITTMGFSIIIELVMRNWITVTNGPDGIGGIPVPSFFGFALNTNRSIFYFALAMLFLVTLFGRQLQKSEFGLALKMVRDDDIAAQASGVNITIYKVIAFVISGMLGGFGGAVYAHVMKYISPGEFSYNQSLIFLVMLVVGGYRSLGGAVVGALLITILPELLRGVKNWQMVIFGLAVVLVIRFLPSGIAGLFMRIKERLAAKTAPVK